MGYQNYELRLRVSLKFSKKDFPIGTSIWEDQRQIIYIHKSYQDKAIKMSDSANPVTENLTENPTEPATPEALTEIIAELEQYRERLVNDTLSMAQRAKIMKSQALASLEPSLAQIDAQIEALRQQQAALQP